MKERNLTRGQISALCEELAALLHAGVGNADGLTLLAEEAQPQEYRKVLKTLSELADSGMPLSAAMVQAGGFPGYVTGLVEVGERTGRLEEALGALAHYYREQEQTRQRLQSALTYPAVLLVLMLVVIVVLLAKVLPIFNEVYASLGGEMRGVAGGLLTLGRGLNTAMPVLCAALGLAVAALAVFTFSAAARDGVLRLWQRRFGDRGISEKMNNAWIARALAMGISSGLGAEEALELAEKLLTDVPQAAGRCEACRAAMVEQGLDLPQALGKSRLLPADACRLLALGFRSGVGDAAMTEAARRLSQEADNALERKVSGIEPALVLATSLLVGAILLSVMLPLMNIMSAIG